MQTWCLPPPTLEDRERRRERLLALLLVSAVAVVVAVSGLTSDRAPFTGYMLAIAVSAIHGGASSGLVAALASVIAVTVQAPTPLALESRLIFAAEGIGVACLVGTLSARRRQLAARVMSAHAEIHELRHRDRHGRTVDAALRHLEEATPETAVLVLNGRGIVTDWRTAAERLYGYTADDVLGVSADTLFAESSAPELAAILREASRTGSIRRTDLHRRKDDGRFHADVAIRPLGQTDVDGFTVAVRDLSRRREWDAYREAAIRAQAALQEAADQAQRQLEALESLTDPALNPAGGRERVCELLERLRTTIGADGVALVHDARSGQPVVPGPGLQPVAAANGLPDNSRNRPVTGRVSLVHNDPDRVDELSGLHWPRTVTSLMVVPVMYDGQVWSTIEVVDERSRRATDFDVALARIAADRLVSVVRDARRAGVVA